MEEINPSDYAESFEEKKLVYTEVKGINVFADEIAMMIGRRNFDVVTVDCWTPTQFLKAINRITPKCFAVFSYRNGSFLGEVFRDTPEENVRFPYKIVVCVRKNKEEVLAKLIRKEAKNAN